MVVMTVVVVLVLFLRLFDDSRPGDSGLQPLVADHRLPARLTGPQPLHDPAP